jgi:Kef-type K+ transport system membrane component KefB/nucleotide-binding universal stress UspA family protein
VNPAGNPYLLWHSFCCFFMFQYAPWSQLRKVTQRMTIHLTLMLAVLLGSGFLLAKLGQRLHLPSVTGYIAAGVLLGPVGLNFANAALLAGRLEHFTEMALMLIAFGIGEHLEIKRLAPVLRTVRLVGMGETLGAYLLTAAGCLGVAVWVGAGGEQWRLINYVMAALLLGAVCVATAPAATLHVLRELKASGALSTILMAVVAVNNGLSIMVFGISVSLVHQLGGDGINLLALAKVMAEIVASLLLGAATGWVMDLTVHRLESESEMLTLGLALLLLCGESARMLNLSPLLAGMAAGFVIVNRDRRDVRVFRTINAFEPPIYVLFFTLAGTHLEPGALIASGWVGLTYFAMRTLGKLLGARVGARLAGASPAVADNIGPALLCQAGVAIGLVFLIQNDSSLAIYAGLVTPVVLTGVVLSELIGPASTRLAVTRAGESASVHRLQMASTGAGSPDGDTAPSMEAIWQGRCFATPVKPNGVVIFGTGHHDTLTQLSRMAVLLAYHYQAEPVAVRVLAADAPSNGQDPHSRAHYLLASARSEVGRLGGNLKTVSIEADGVSEGLLEIADQHRTHALLLGHPKEKSPQKFQQIFEKTFRRATCPVIIAHLENFTRIGRILVPVTAEVELHIVCPVIRSLAYLGPHTVTLMWLLPFGVSENEVELHNEILRAWAVRNGLDPIVEFRVIETQARLETILAAAADQDLIVIATRSGGGLSRLIWGSLAEAVARTSERPTVIVHQRAPVVSVEEMG